MTLNECYIVFDIEPEMYYYDETSDIDSELQ